MATTANLPKPDQNRSAHPDQLIDTQLVLDTLHESFTDAVASVVSIALLSVEAFVQSCRNPYVIDLVKRTSKTVVLTAAAHYLLLTAVLWPLRLVSWLLYLVSFSLIRLDVAALVSSSMSVYPLLTLLLIRYVYPAQMQQCFLHTLTELDPGYARHLAARPRSHRASVAQQLLRKLGVSGEESEDMRLVLLTMAAGMLLRGWRSMPYVGPIVAPILQFLSIRYMVGRPAAAVAFSLLAALHPSWERAVMNFVELWASSKVLGTSSMRYFLERCVPRAKRPAFTRMFEYTLVAYFLLPTALLRLPLLGSLVAFPAAALGAYALQDIVSRHPSLRDAFDHL